MAFWDSVVTLSSSTRDNSTVLSTAEELVPHLHCYKNLKSHKPENSSIFVMFFMFFCSCVDGNSQDPERERRPFSRTLAIPMIHQTHTTCVSKECMRELTTHKMFLVTAKRVLSVTWFVCV